MVHLNFYVLCNYCLGNFIGLRESVVIYNEVSIRC